MFGISGTERGELSELAVRKEANSRNSRYGKRRTLGISGAERGELSELAVRKEANSRALGKKEANFWALGTEEVKFCGW